MKSILGQHTATVKLAKIKFLDRIAKKLILSKLHHIREGHLTLIDRSGGTENEQTLTFGDPHSDPSLNVTVTIHRPEAYSKVAFGGSIGTGESYIHEDFDVSDLSRLTRLFVRNAAALEGLDSGSGKWIQWTQKSLHRLRSNQPKQAIENIRAHYDLGNDFFKLFLDPSMMYSAAIFKSESDTLQKAQENKLRAICEKLQLRPHHRVLEIGTGWGGFAIFAAKNYGCHVTTTTISDRQFEYAQARIHEEGLESKITLLKKDYRALNGLFDKLVSIEMIEAVGLNFLDQYFQKCSDLLKPDGDFLLQSILISEQVFESAARSVDFIQTHVFPGSAIPSIERIMRSIKTRTDFRLSQFAEFGEDYAETLRIWHENLREKKSTLTALGYPKDLYRHWHYYLSYCEGGFREHRISVGHLLLSKPRSSSQGEKIRTRTSL